LSYFHVNTDPVTTAVSIVLYSLLTSECPVFPYVYTVSCYRYFIA